MKPIYSINFLLTKEQIKKLNVAEEILYLLSEKYNSGCLLAQIFIEKKNPNVEAVILPSYKAKQIQKILKQSGSKKIKRRNYLKEIQVKKTVLEFLDLKQQMTEKQIKKIANEIKNERPNKFSDNEDITM